MKRSIPLEIKSEIFKQLVEHSKSVTENAIFQNIGTQNGITNFRVIVFDDTKFDELLDYCEASTHFVPINFEEHQGLEKGIKEFKDLKVKFLKPLKHYGIFGISWNYRMVSEDGHLLFWITEKAIPASAGTEAVINGRVKKEIDYHAGGIINHIFYVRIKEEK